MKMAAKHYQKSEEKLWKEARESYQNLSEEKNKKRKQAREMYQIFSEEKKKRKKVSILSWPI